MSGVALIAAAASFAVPAALVSVLYGEPRDAITIALNIPAFAACLWFFWL